MAKKMKKTIFVRKLQDTNFSMRRKYTHCKDVDALCLVLGSYKFQDFDINNDGWIMMGEVNGSKIFKEDLTATAICGSICYNP